jgi:hypothetical protein
MLISYNHAFHKKERQAFRGLAYHRPKPELCTGDDLFDMVRDLEVIFGKGPGGQSVPNDIATRHAPMWKINLYFGSLSIGKT